MKRTKNEARALLAEAMKRLPHGYAYRPGKACPVPSCFRCEIAAYLRRPARLSRKRGERTR